MSFPYKIRISGEMGHDLVFIGKIIGEAAVVQEGYYAIQCQTYGQEVRGEANCSDIIISDKHIFCPGFERPNILLCLNQTACCEFTENLEPKGVLIIDSDNVVDLPERHEREYHFPIFQTARDHFGNHSSACLVALGVLSGFLKKIPFDSIQKSLNKFDIGERNSIKEMAVQIGYDLARRKYSHKLGVA